MRILVTGGAGFIGSHLCEALDSRNHEAISLDVQSDDTDGLSKEGDILNRETVYALVKDSDFVFHLAAQLGVKNILTNTAWAMHTNVRGTENVLDACTWHRKPVLIASTSEVYGKSDKVPFCEEDDLVIGPSTKSRWSYAASKLLDEFMALSCGAPAIVARIFNTVGLRQSAQYGMVLPTFIKQALAGEPITVHGSGKQSRCFCDVRDTVEALIRLMEVKAYGQVVNVGNTTEISIENLARMVKRITGSKSEITYVPYQDAYGSGYEDMNRRVPSIKKLYDLTGFAPSIRLSQTIEWIAGTSSAREAESVPCGASDTIPAS
jgi:UDP-glucose 4-epimerase